MPQDRRVPRDCGCTALVLSAAGTGAHWQLLGPAFPGGRAGAHPAQPRGVPGWGCPGRSLRTCRGRPAPPAALPREKEEEEEEEEEEAEIAAEQERRWKEWERDRSDGTGGPRLCPPAGIDHPHTLPPLPELSDLPLMPGKLRRSRREVLGEKQWQSLEERGSAHLGQPKLTRSRTYESSCKETEQAATGTQGPPSPSAVVPVDSVSAIKKTNTALLVPNAVSIRTAKGEKFLFVSLRQREATYQLLRSVCKHLQDSGQSPRNSVNNEETLRKSQISSFSDLEQSTPEPNSLHKSLGHSSIVSWSPADEPNPTSRQAEDEDDGVALLVPSSSEWVPSAETCGLWGGPHTVLQAWATALWSQINPQLSPLNIIIIIYLLLMVALLLSSGYIGLRIAELEQQLAFVGAWPHLNLSQQYKTT
ncbi:uncharacterized protein LOC107215409 isoform X3 [Parus major]|uniref:uncharacterized protein LOC107215409 isoform X3 n=1 Tax=Parus major TaxID=9157 RepID=UPI0014439147|nr:uncharacterized protein LOC107215409 isoform X3 [Parus major]